MIRVERSSLVPLTAEGASAGRVWPTGVDVVSPPLVTAARRAAPVAPMRCITGAKLESTVWVTAATLRSMRRRFVIARPAQRGVTGRRVPTMVDCRGPFTTHRRTTTPAITRRVRRADPTTVALGTTTATGNLSFSAVTRSAAEVATLVVCSELAGCVSYMTSRRYGGWSGWRIGRGFFQVSETYLRTGLARQASAIPRGS